MLVLTRGIYKVSASDYSYSLFLRDKAPVEILLNQKVIGKSKTKFCVISMSEQTVKLKVHWLPLFYDNRLIKAFLADFDTVLDVQLCKSSYANVCAYNGLREVLLKTDEINKHRITHLIKLESGQSVLLTIQWRPPLCLKCNQVGHVRKDCTVGRSKSYANAAVRPPVAQPSGVSLFVYTRASLCVC